MNGVDLVHHAEVLSEGMRSGPLRALRDLGSDYFSQVYLHSVPICLHSNILIGLVSYFLVLKVFVFIAVSIFATLVF